MRTLPRPEAHVVLCILAAAALAMSAEADTITVDVNGQGDYSSLFVGIYWSAAGDTILVFPGVYTGSGNHNLTLPARDLTLMSSDGPEDTIIDLEGTHNGITFSPSNTTAMVIDGLTFKNGDNGYGDFAILVSDGAGCTIRNCVFENDSRVWFENAGTKRIEDCVFTRTLSALRVRENDRTSVRSCVFQRNILAIQVVDERNYSGDFSATGCTFDGNGTAMDIYTRATVVVESCSFSNNTAWGYEHTGACIDLSTSTNLAAGYIRHCTFTGNSSTRNAGAISLRGDYGPVWIEDCVFEGNSAAESGGAFVNRGSRFTMSRCTFHRNTADTGGAVDTGDDGAIDTAEIIDCVFTENEARVGGAVAATHEKTEISECVFLRNSADMGAAVFSGENRTEISDCLFSDNRAHLWGAGVCAVEAQLAPGINIYNSTFERNRSHRGSAVMLDHSRGTVDGCTFFGNSAEDALIVATRASRADVYKCMMSFNNTGAPVAVQLQSAAHIYNCLAFENAGGDSLSGYMMYEYDCLYTDPLMCDIVSGDYSLCANSPCLPGGNPWGVAIGAHGEGCSSCNSPVEATSWGAIKALYR